MRWSQIKEKKTRLIIDYDYSYRNKPFQNNFSSLSELCTTRKIKFVNFLQIEETYISIKNYSLSNYDD